jgi:hypothetical protein
MIRELVLAAGLIYAGIALLQYVEVRTIPVQSALIAVALIVLSAIHWATGGTLIKQREMVVLWIAVILFAAYGLAIGGGLL